MSIRDAWLEFNAARGGMQNRLMQQNLPEFFGVMGMNYRPEQTDQSGLTYGGAGTPGGLMAGDLQDPRTWLTASMGLMSLPGYQQMGNQMLNSVMQQQLALPMQQAQAQRQAEIDNRRLQKLDYELEQAELKSENMVGGRTLEKYSDDLGEWYKGYLNNTKDLRTNLANVNTLLDRIGPMGDFAGLSNADQMAMISSYIKMLRPNEAINEGDIASMKRIEGLPGFVYSYLESIGSGNKLPVGAVAQLTRSLLDQYQTRRNELGEARRQAVAMGQMQKLQDFQQLMAPELPQRDLGPLYGQIQKQWNKGLGSEPDLPGGPGVGDPVQDDELKQQIIDQANKENPSFWDRLNPF